MRVVFVGKHRSITKRVLLHLATFGVSRRVWTHRVNKEVDGHEALGIHHRLEAVMLASPLLALVLFLSLLPVNLVVAASVAGPFLLPGTIVTYRMAARVSSMLGDTVPYGPAFVVYMSTWLPIIGTSFFLGWSQSRLNRFWAEARTHPEQGIDIDLDLEKDPRFVVEMKKAQKRSVVAGSRFDRSAVRRQERLAAFRDRLDRVSEERRIVREMGGSTPVLPFLRPRRPPVRRLAITCGRCEHSFETTHDPMDETVLHCPRCGLQEVLPSLADDPLAGTEKAAYAALQATCPDCDRTFHAPRRLGEATQLVCPQCGRTDTVP